MIDLSALGLTPEVQAMILQGLVLASALLPVLQRIAAATRNTWDNRLVAVLERVLVLAPRVRLGGK